MSRARLEHFIIGLVFVGMYLYLKERRGDRQLLHPVALVVACPVLYLGTAISDWDITLLGIGWHRNPLFHSAIPYVLLAWGWHKLGLAEIAQSIAGPRLNTALHVSMSLGLASHMALDIWQYGNVQWIPGGTLDRLWLAGHGLFLIGAAWFPPLPRADGTPPQSAV